MAGEQFSLCWDNFHKNMSSGMHSLLETEDLVDVTLAVEGKYLKAHKMVLSLCSPYFRELFQVNPCKHPIVFMKDVSYLALSDLLTFMYQGEVQVNQEHLGTFIKTAEALQIKGLTADSNSSNENEMPEVHDDPLDTPTQHKKIEEEKIQVPRPKKQPHTPSGPSPHQAKRQKVAVEKPSIPPMKTDTSAALESVHVPTTQEILQFKVEPYESGEQPVQVKEGMDESQVTEQFDESVDDGEDYSMIEGEDEPQAGTSTEGVGDGQGLNMIEMPFEVICYEGKEGILKKKRSVARTRYVYDGFVYHCKVTSGTPPTRYLGCAEIKRNGCRARAIMPVGASVEELRVTKPHNHPPDENAEEKEEFLKQLKSASRSMPGSLKKVYDNISVIYPKASAEIPFKSICSSLHRWRRTL